MSALRHPLFLLFSAALLAGSLQSATPGLRPFPHEQSDLRADPLITWGRLENGLRYAIRPNGTPANRAALYLIVEVGSYHERDNERGFAHFVEHMAFNGTRRFPRDEAVRRLESLGAGFGPHANAETSLFATTYHFEVPTRTPRGIETCLQILRDMASDVTFSTREVESEREVIFSESRGRAARFGVTARWADHASEASSGLSWEELRTMGEGTRLATRHPLGKGDTLRAARSRALYDFYRRWYRPARTTLVIVGDVDPATLKRQIEHEFASWRTPKIPDPDEPFEPLALRPKGSGIRLLPESRADLVISLLQPQTPYPAGAVETSAHRLETRSAQSALAMLARRLDRRIEQERLPIVGKSLDLTDTLPRQPVAALRLQATPQGFAAAMGATLEEMERIRRHGFTEAEVDLWKEIAVSRARQDCRGADAVSSLHFARAIAFGIVEGAVFTDPSDSGAEEALIAQVTASSARAAFLRLWPEAPAYVRVVLPRDPVLEAELPRLYEQVSAQAEKSGAAPGSALEEPRKEFPYRDFGPAGQITRREHVAEGDWWRIDFANGVKLRMKINRAEKNRAKLGMRAGQGLLEDPDALPAIAFTTPFLWLGGINRLSGDEFGMLFAAKATGANVMVGETRALFTIEAEVEDLPLFFGLMAAYASDPAYRENGYVQALGLMQAHVSSRLTRLQSRTSLELQGAMLPGYRPLNHRPPEEFVKALRAITPAQARAWAEHVRQSGPIELSLVGDFEIEPAIEAAARTVGALPALGPAADVAHARRVGPYPAPFRNRCEHDFGAELAMIASAWPVDPRPDLHKYATMQLLRTLFEERIRVRIREELGGTYSPDVQLTYRDQTEPATALLYCGLAVSPHRIQEMARAFDRLTSDLAKRPPSAAELQAALAQILTDLENKEGQNDYWLDLLGTSTDPAHDMAYAAGLPARVRQIRAEEIQAAASEVFGRKNQRTWLVVPKATPRLK